MSEKVDPIKCEKEALTFEHHADRLIQRRLKADRDELISRLMAVSYYRFSGYLYPFRSLDGDQFKGGTSLDTIWKRYCFDRRLRVLVLDAIERVETLFEEYPEIPIKDMGLPVDWRTHPVWQNQ